MKYKIFAAFSDTCWRQYTQTEYDFLSEACDAADKATEDMDWVGVDFTVAYDRDSAELYRAKFKKVKS